MALSLKKEENKNKNKKPPGMVIHANPRQKKLRQKDNCNIKSAKETATDSY